MENDIKFIQYLVLHGHYCNSIQQSWYQTERGARNAVDRFFKAGEKVGVRGVYVKAEPFEHTTQVRLDPDTFEVIG